MSGPPPASASSERRNRPGIEKRTEPWPGASLHYTLPRGDINQRPLNGADRNKRNSFLARPAKNLIRKISDSCKLCSDLCAYRAKDSTIAAQSLRMRSGPDSVQVVVSIRFFRLLPLFSATWQAGTNTPTLGGGIPIDPLAGTVCNGAHEVSAWPESEPGALHRRRPSKPAGSDFKKYGEDS